MNISYRWIRALAPSVTETPRELADRLGMLGAPVDELTDLGAGLGEVVIARVESVRPHPNADRLRVCEVAAGGAAVQVVCGAPNVEAGRYYPFAPVGATLPGGMTIGKAKLRGETSEGMLCSARELGLGRDHAGLMTLRGEWEPGTPLREQLGLDDARLLIDVTANRPDLLSHLGVARELAPGGAEAIRLEPFAADGEPRLELRTADREAEAQGVRVRIEDPVGCPRYTAAVIRGVRVEPSPEWLATRLRAIGLRPINNVVDATNYVLFELGQPLHAFDLDTLEGREIRVREAAAGETIRTLDGLDRPLDREMLVIADARRPVAIAGVMGGEETEVSAGTTSVLLECARFDERRVRKTARKLGLSTDASYRFERGVDPDGQPRALRRVVDLILAVAGGAADAVGLDVHALPAERCVLVVRPARVERVLGVPLTGARIAELLRPIGFAVEEEEGGALRVEVPGYRPDVRREIDVIEEVARRHGYDAFPEELRAYRPGTVPEDDSVALHDRLHRLLEGRGFLEARTAGFAPAADGRVPLLNPLSAEESHLRDALVPGLLRRLEHNWAHGVRHVRLHEIGAVFLPASGGGLPGEEVRLAAVFTGARRPPHWTGEPGEWDVWDLKALLGELVGVLGLEVGAAAADGALDALTEPAERLALRDGDGRVVGGGGRVAARAVDAPAWAGPVWVLEVGLPASLPAKAAVRYLPIPEFPAVERDLALLVPAGVAAAAVEQAIRESAGELLERVWPFDLYVGEGIPEGARSLAWRLRFRRADRTLTDEEVDAAVAVVLATLRDRLDVHRR
jgi:phenylalanyl-tRNA synthetase beta chain